MSGGRAEHSCLSLVEHSPAAVSAQQGPGFLSLNTLLPSVRQALLLFYVTV